MLMTSTAVRSVSTSPAAPAFLNVEPVLIAQHLRKSYSSSANHGQAQNQRPAVDDLSLQLRPGELLGLVGPNGAGKSTLVAMLCGLTLPDSGQVQVAGINLLQDSASCKRRIGLVTQDLALFDELSTRDNLAIFGALYGLKGAVLKQRMTQVLETVGLTERERETPATFSGGMKRRLHIACALLHDPDVLLLDEPTAGVDPQSRHAIFDCLLKLKAAGKALLYTTHYMEEVEKLADRIVIMDAGRVVAEGTLPELMRLLPPMQKLELEIDDGLPQGDPASTHAQRADQLQAQRACLLQAGIQNPHWQAGRWQISPADLTLGNAAAMQALIAAIDRAGWQLRSVSTARASLEDVFLHITGRQLRD